MNQIEKMWEKINSFDYVSFDIFDTLLFRTVLSPEDVFDFVQYVYNEKHNDKIHNFRKTRIRYEIKLREEKQDREITLEEIYQNLPYESRIKNELCELERTIEINSCIPNKPMIELFKRCCEYKKNIILISDMYLNRETIEKMLANIGVKDNYILFLSSEEGTTKKSGKLFPRVLDLLKINSSEIIHIGDNEYTDIKMAEQIGIKAEFRLKCYQNINLYQKKKGTIKYNHLKALFKNEYIGQDLGEYRVGYTVVGPLLYAFCNWIHEQKIKRGYEKVLFVSREGYLIEKIYKIMFPRDKTQYIYLNKNLLRFPLLDSQCSVENLIDTLPAKNAYTLKELLDVLNIKNNEKYANRVNIFNLIPKKEILNGKYDDLFKEIFNDVKLELKKQNEYLLGYLKQERIFEDKVLLVNNSINGNGQIMIQKILKRNNVDADILGLQFVKSRKCRQILKDKCVSWTSDDSLSGRYTMRFNRYALLLEHFMFEPSGTAIRFDKDTNDIYRVICDSQREEKNNNIIIEKIQKNAIQFVRDYMETIPLKLSSDTIKAVDNLYKNPMKQDIDFLKKLYDVDFDGSNLLYLKMAWKQIQYKEENDYVRLFLINLYEEIFDGLKTCVSVVKRKLLR